VYYISSRLFRTSSHMSGCSEMNFIVQEKSGVTGMLFPDVRDITFITLFHVIMEIVTNIMKFLSTIMSKTIVRLVRHFTLSLQLKDLNIFQNIIFFPYNLSAFVITNSWHISFRSPQYVLFRTQCIFSICSLRIPFRTPSLFSSVWRS
jgi:hypothetical protein